VTETRRVEVEEVLSALRAAIKKSGRTYREIEKEMSMSTGYLVHLLSGSREMRIRQLIEICGTIGLSPAELFSTKNEHHGE
jgi:transcriptional regulator with XRE-family HTH domain